MKQLPISEASDEQLAHFAKTVQQLDSVPTNRGAILAALLKSGYEADFIVIDGEPERDDSPELVQLVQPRETAAKMPANGFGYWRGSPMVQLRILSTERPGGNEPAAPTINGSPPLVIQRGKLVEIPYDFYLVLKQAGGTKVVPGARPEDDNILVDYYDFPMADVKLPSDEAIAAWQGKTSGDELGKPKAARAA